MSGFLLFLIFSEVLLPSLTYASRVRRQTTKVRISAVGNTITLKFLQTDKDTKLKGYILGYGSSLFSKQLIQLPGDGEPYETEIDAEPKYLVAVQPVKDKEVKKQCTGKETMGKPLHLVIGSVTPTSVMLSWGTLLNTLSTETNLDDCIEDSQYTVRYREKELKKTWNYQTCPTRETVIDQLKPDTPYEFGVRAESENISGAWSPPVTHNTAVKEIDIHTPLKPENILMKPITESTQTFSPSVPVTQSRPAFLLKDPEPPPTQRVTQANKHNSLKPENPLRNISSLGYAKPITKSPQTFSSSSVPVLNSATQKTAASHLRHLEPPPTQRATQDIHKPLRSEMFLRPEKLSTESTEAFSPSVPVVTLVVSSPTFGLRHPEPLSTQREMLVLHSVIKSRPAFLFRHPAPSPVPRVTLGTGSDGLRTSRLSEESLFLTQTLTSTHTPLSNLKSTNILQTLHSTKPTLLITTEQLLHSTQSQTIFSTVKAQLIETPQKRTKLHNNSSAIKFITTRIHEKTAKLPIRTTQPKTGPPKHYTIYHKTSRNQSQHSTTKSQLKMTQIRFTTVKPSVTQAQPHAAQPKSFISQSQLDSTNPKFITTHSPPHIIKLKYIATKSPPHTIQFKSITTQSPPHTIQLKSITTQSPPHTIQLKSITTQSLPHTIQLKSITTQSPPHTIQLKSIATHSPPHTIQLKSISTQAPPHTIQLKSIATHSPPHTIQLKPITTKTQFYNTQSKPIATQILSITTQSQPHIIQPKPIEPQSSHHKTKSQTHTVTCYLSTDQLQPTTILPQPFTAQTQSIGTQFQPHTMQSQPNRIQPKIKKPHSIKNGTTKPQTKTIQPKLIINNSKTKMKLPKPRPQQSYTIQSKSISAQTITAKSQDNFRSHQQPVMNQKPNYVTKPNFTPKPNTYYQTDYYSTSATIKLSNKKNSPWGEKKPVNKKIPVSQMAPSQSMDGHQTKPVLVRVATNRNQGQDVSSPLASVASTSTSTITKRVSIPNPIDLPPTYLNISVKNPQVTHDEKHKGQLWNKRQKWNKKKPESNKIKNQLNQVDKFKDKATDLKVVDALPILKPSTPTTMQIYRKPTPTTILFFAYNGSRFNMGDNTSVFSSVPISDLDPMGKKRFVAPHVVYQIDKPPEQPCSVTHSLSFFPDEENNVTNITGPPRTPPTNLTVVTVEGCPSFVILDWETADNETTEYEVTSFVKSPNGRVVSVVKTNQTHTAVENLKPESSYEFTVTPKNELGSGPSSESVSFSTESADPRVSEIPTGKNAIWSSFAFDADSYSECTGTQYVKRTWYRKFVGIQLCNSLRYKIYLSASLKGKFYDIGDETGYGEDHCQFVDSFLDGRTGGSLPHQLPPKQGYFRAMRQEPVKFGKIGGSTQINYVSWYECGVPIPGSW